MAKEKINWLLILQGWAMLWVIIGHSPMGGAYGTDSEIVMSLQNFAYSFHMPCFIFISGYLFYLTRINSCMKWSDMLTDKLKRFGIPYIVFSIVTLIIKYIASDNVARPIELSFYQLFMTFISPGNGPLALLWFILVILWYFALSPVWKYVLNRKALSIITIIILLILNIANMPYYQILSFTSTLKFGIYFFLGLLFAKYNFVQDIKNTSIYAFLVAIVIYITGRMYDVSFMSAISAIVFSIILSLCADKYIPKLFFTFRNYTYQIYLMGIFFQVFVKLLYKKGFISTYELGIVFNVILGVYMPVLISIIVKKINFRPLGLCLGLVK